MKKKRKYIWLSAFACGLLLFACNSTNVQQSQKTYEYLFLGHTYQPDSAKQKVDSRVEQINFGNYDLVLLGGDITENTTLERSNLYYIDSVFDLKSSKTYWAVGNHDLSHPEYITEFTEKPLFYAFCKNNITFVVLNSQDDSCRITGRQLELVKAVTDTIRQSGHLMLLQHKLVWLYGHPELEKMQHLANGGLGSEHWQVLPNNFHSEIYPMLKTVLAKGIQVICISGDIGINANKFEYISNDGIYFLASGLSRNGGKNDRVLLLKHNRSSDSLWWEFKNLTTLIREQKQTENNG